MALPTSYAPVHPPTDAAEDAAHQVQSAVTGAAAASLDWASAVVAAGYNGKVWVTVEAVTTPVYVRFVSTASTATTADTGRGIAAGTKERFLADTTKHGFIDHISTGAGVIKVQVDSFGMWDRRHV